MNAQDNDKLKSLFQGINLDEPSAGFEDRLMLQVHHVAARQKRRIRVISVFSIIGGVVAAIGIPVLIFHLYGLTIDKDSFAVDYTIPHLQFDPLMLSIAGTILLLLVGDLLIRKRIWERKHKN
ncbi:type VI protein secretion system component VasF [Dysgonomonas hofstadii]|uniref:Type VI protein secretion system component VasF n=1 Tax=Dysgonomonas hofstadii TaxID=637886 RepID=A0A840CL41_9BACT|nr:hypothetical protein [Dysgonomonas hofstadii]MBB4036086.1 type VI protein secretion system component VasF [Dysgonomonas hofstadii]